MEEKKPRILVVDDEWAFCEVLRAGLEMHGVTARVETRSTETIGACLEFHPDLVLLDIDMPIKDGGQVAAELRTHPTLQRIPVVFLSSVVIEEETGTRNASRELLWSKQMRIAELVDRIRDVLRSEALHSATGDLPVPQTSKG